MSEPLAEYKADSLATALGKSLLGNQQSGMGIQGKDPFTQVVINNARLLSEHEIRALYRGSWLIRRIIDTPAQDMTRKGVEIIIHEGGDESDASAALALYDQGGQNVSPYSRQLSGHDAFRRAKRDADLFGRAYIVMRVNGAEDPARPLRTVRSFEGLSVLNRYQLRPSIGTLNHESPEFYQVARAENRDLTTQGGLPFNQKIHHSRVLVFDGAEIHPYDLQLEGDGGHDSVLQGIYEIFFRHYSAKDAISKGLDSYSLMKVSIDGLKDVLTGPGGEEALSKALNSIAQMMSLHKVLVQDAQSSNSDFQERTFTGVHENFQAIVDELTASTGLPFYKIWGTVGKSALADSGGAETRAYAEQVQSWQAQDFMSNHRILFHAIFEALGNVPDEWEIEYPSIYSETPEEMQGKKKSQAETFKLLIESGVVSANEARLAISTGQPIENVIDDIAPDTDEPDTEPDDDDRDDISERNDAAIKTGTRVSWNYGGGTGSGVVTGVFPRKVQRTIKGAKVVRNGSEDNPALTIEQDDGARVLKLASEVRTSAKKSDAEPFVPSAAQLSNPSYLEALADEIEWADVRSLATEQGWQWDDEIGRYVDGDRPVTESEVMDVVESELDAGEAAIQAITDALIAGESDVNEWERQLAELIAAAAALFFLFGLGSADKLTDEHTDFVRDRLNTQYQYLRQFSELVAAGSLSAAMIGARAELYIHDAESNHGYAQDFAHDADEFPFYSNVLGSVRPCEQCPRETAKGIVPRGSLPAIGNRLCLSRCHCHFAYYRSQDEERRDTIPKFGWVGQSLL